MGIITKPKTWADDENVTFTDLNDDFDTVYNEINGNITNANINAGAAIAGTKIGTALANKTLTKPKVTQPYTDIVTESDGATITFNLSTGQIQQVLLAGNRTLALSNEQVGQVFMVKLIQDSAGSRTVTWWSGINWSNGVVPTLATAVAHWDILGFIVTNTGVYDGVVVGSNFS